MQLQPMSFRFMFIFVKNSERNKCLRIIFHGFFSELVFYLSNNFAIYDNVFLKFTCSERLLVLVSWWLLNNFAIYDNVFLKFTCSERLLVLVSWWCNKARLNTQ